MVESARSFGRRIEYWVTCQALKQGLDVFIPVVDDKGVDLLIRRNDKTYIEVQVKGRSKNIIQEDAASFSPINHTKRDNYFSFSIRKG